MKTEVTFILFMILIYAIVLGYLWVKTRSEKKRCQNCAFFTLRKESKSVGVCKQHSNCHLYWEEACKLWKHKTGHQNKTI